MLSVVKLVKRHLQLKDNLEISVEKGDKMKISNLAEKDFEEVVEFLNETMPYDKFSVELLKEQTTGDSDYDPALTFVAREKKVEGFVLGMCRGIQSYNAIKVFSVRESKNCLETGISLLEKVEEQFIERGILNISIGRCPGKYLQPGLDARYTAIASILLKKGYQVQGVVQNMEVDLAMTDLDTEKEEKELKKEGIITRRLEKDDRQRFMDYLQKGSGGVFFYSSMLAFNNNPVSAHIALKDDKVIGHALHSVTTGHYFGHEGVSAEMQGKGIGQVLLKRCLKDIKAMGEKKAIILNAGPVYFYWKTVGARIPRLLWKMSKEFKK